MTIRSLLIASLILITSNAIFSQEKAFSNKTQGKSTAYVDKYFGPDNSGYPQPFNRFENPRTRPAVSTGYYFVDSHEMSPPYLDPYWHPTPIIEDTFDVDDGVWHKILPGPRITSYPNPDSAVRYWAKNPNGHAYFRNPAYPVSGNCFMHGEIYSTDSTDDAIAGPMPLAIKGGFYFNGIRYDSFYVSANGIIALTNRRYLYDDDGNRKIGPHGDCYDRMSMDWFNPTGGRPKTGIGTAASLTDTVPDNFGYRYSVLHNNPSNPHGGIRARGGHLDSIFNNNYRSAVIAPFFGDLHLSQYDAKKKKIDSYGKVYYKTFDDSNKTVIYFINTIPVRALTIANGIQTIEAPLNSRPGSDSAVSGNAQVIFNAGDSTVTIVYEVFMGYVQGKYLTTAARSLFLFNTTCGVLGWGRHVNNYKGKNAVNYQEYLQYTHYFSKYLAPKETEYYKFFGSVKFKQWKNTLGVLSFYYRVRPLDNTKPLDYTESVPTSLVNNFEILAGEERLGGVQPVVLIQNLSNDITQVDPAAPGSPNPADYPGTGVNSVRQDMKFRTRFKIFNPFMNKVIYNKLMPVDSAGIWLPDNYDAQNDYYGNPYCKVRYVTVSKNGDNYETMPSSPLPQGMNGIPPYGFAEVYFPPFEPNGFDQDKYKNFTNIGKMKAIATCEATDPQTGVVTGDQWPGDDSISANLFVMKRLTSFSDDFSDFYVSFPDIYKINNTTHIYTTPAFAQPSAFKWVNVGGEIVKGESVSKHPLPPRRPVPSTKSYFRNINSVYDNAEKYDYTSPCLNMNRLDLDGTDFSIEGLRGGDEIRSFPIDLRMRIGSVLSLSIQRTYNYTSRDLRRGFSDLQLIGCEPRAILNGDPYQPFNTSERSAAFSADEICVEFAKPSPDQINGITNIGLPLPYVAPEKRGTWRYHPRRGGAAPVTNMAAFTLYGAGGAMRGFLEFDKDSALTQVTGLRSNIFDDGFDESFQKIFIPIPDTFIRAANEGAKNFRFRIRVNARNDEKINDIYPFPDDNDDFYIDNVNIYFPSSTDIENVSCGIINPYLTIPPRQAAKIPVYVTVFNNTCISAPSFFVKVRIFHGTKDTLYDPKPIYCKRVERPYLTYGQTVTIPMPEWDATLAGINNTGKFFMVAMVRIPGGDMEIKNDTTFNEFSLNFGEHFGYDTPTPDGQKHYCDVPFEAGGWSFYKFNKDYNNWRGLSISGYNYGGIGNYNSIQEYDNDPYALGDVDDTKTGQFAMKFELKQADTIKGLMAYSHSYGSSPDYINLSVYKDSAGLPHGRPIEGTLLEKRYRGNDDIRNETYFDEYCTYLLKKPVVLPKGVYWASVAQLSLLGLGASGNRMGMRTINVSIPPPINITREVGKQGNTLMLHKEFRIIENDSIKGNDNIFAYENIYNSGDWHPFMPTTGNPAYAHSHHFGASYADGYNTWTLTNGTWLPFIKPYFGPQETSGVRLYENCWDDPVELTAFSAKPLQDGISLFWETASEINNHGFYVEKSIQGGSPDWKQIAFIKGKGNSNRLSRYSYLDSDVSRGNIYCYRLRQIDLDGSAGCSNYSDIVTIKYGGSEQKPVLEQNYPNPFSSRTLFRFSLPDGCNVKFEIIDLLGNRVATLLNGYHDGREYQISWDRTNETGTKAAPGTYIYKLTAGAEVLSGKMTIE